MNASSSTPMRILHGVLGAVGLAVGFHAAHTGAASVVLILGSISYVSWTAGRGAGLALAIAAGALELLHQHQYRVDPAEAFAISTMWLLLYILVALITSGLEVATRPAQR